MFKNVIRFLFCLTLLNQTVWAESLPDFAAIHKQNADAVVTVKVFQKYPATIESAQAWSPETSGLGSGFVISEDGYILTNAHVVEVGNGVTVKFADRRELAATVVGYDKATDIALLKVNASGLTSVKMGSVTELEVGEWVMAIGAPFGFEQSVTKGIVSAKNRVVSKRVYVPLIQTDAAINQGNSGGPLFNHHGLVVGVNSSTYTVAGGGYLGLSFAVPIDIAMSIVPQLKANGKVTRGWLGINTQDVPFDVAQSNAISGAYGAMVSIVGRGSPAQKAGLKVGDIVTAFNDERVENSTELPLKISQAMAGERVNVKIIRQGERKMVEVKLGVSRDY